MAQRSIYVTVVGWIFIVFSGIALLEALFFAFMPAEKFLAAARQSGQAAGPQPDPAIMGGFLHGMGYVMLVLSLWVLGSSIGLILRKGWARISFIVILGIGIFFDAIYLLFAIVGATMMPKLPNQSDGMAAFGQSLMVFMIVFCGGLLAFYIWTLIVLNTERVKAEFEKPKMPAPANP